MNEIIEFQEISFQQVEKGITIPNDLYGIAGYALTPARKKAFLENPFLNNKDVPMIVLGKVDGVVGGRAMQYPDLIKAGNDILSCTSGSSLEVYKDFRHLALGTEIVLNPIVNKRSETLLYADFSEDGVNIYKSLRFKMFSLKKMIQPRKSKFILQMIGFKGFLLKITSFIVDIVLKPIISISNLLFNSNLNDYVIEELKVVPNWVDDIVLNDGHKYMEVHDHRWLQWNLNNMFHENKRNTNSFYSVKKDSEPVGFFMTKERHSSIKKRKIDNILVGTIVEWGVKRNSDLSEGDIFKMALKTFSKDLDIIQVFTNDTLTIKTMNKLCFFHHKKHYIAFKDLTKRYKDSGNPELWRLRFGYSDSIFN